MTAARILALLAQPARALTPHRRPAPASLVTLRDHLPITVEGLEGKPTCQLFDFGLRLHRLLRRWVEFQSAGRVLINKVGLIRRRPRYPYLGFDGGWER